MTCQCGAEISAADLEALIDPVLAHMSEAHAEFRVTRVDVRNYLEAEDRSAGASTERLDTIGEVEVVPISPGQVGAIARFFDYDALPDNPQWASCYCVSYFPEGGDKPWQENRASLCNRVETGTVTGALAYVDGTLAGWCNATARAEIPRRATGDDSGVCSVICFVISPPYRFHGISGKLLDGAIDHARASGFTLIEGYPRPDWDKPEHAFSGPIRLYEEAGFEKVSEDPLTYQLKL